MPSRPYPVKVIRREEENNPFIVNMVVLEQDNHSAMQGGD